MGVMAAVTIRAMSLTANPSRRAFALAAPLVLPLVLAPPASRNPPPDRPCALYLECVRTDALACVSLHVPPGRTPRYAAMLRTDAELLGPIMPRARVALERALDVLQGPGPPASDAGLQVYVAALDDGAVLQHVRATGVARGLYALDDRFHVAPPP